MPLFAAPVPETAVAAGSRLHLATNSRRKRKEPQQTSSDDFSLSENDEFPQASTNPLSLTPAEIAQYRLAGLNLNEDLPRVKGFPHRALSPESISGNKRSKERKNRKTASPDDNVAGNIGGKKWSTLRTQHLNVLTTLLHKCLLDGDIPRATRAYAILIRTRIGGQGVNIRSSGYWGIGAELLVRSSSQDTPPKLQYADAEKGKSTDQSWGDKEGLAKAKEYYEWLILQYPYRKQFDTAVTEIDFWPAMLGCEIYGIQLEQRERLRKIEDEEDLLNDNNDSDSEVEQDLEVGINNDDATVSQHRRACRLARRAERHWENRDHVRRASLEAALALATRMDDLMIPAPFSNSHALLRLRGMLALYCGDLSVPAPPIGDDGEDRDDYSSASLRSSRLRSPEIRALYRQRISDHELGKIKQQTERELANNLFARIRRDGGWLPGDLGLQAVIDEDNDFFQ